MYLQPKRYYQNVKTGRASPLLRDVIKDRVTINPSFDCGNRRGTWHGSPFKEIETMPPAVTVPSGIHCGGSNRVEISDLFDEICASIERNWRSDKFHVVFHSSGWDSRIISAAIKRLGEKNGPEWLGAVLYLANRWEAEKSGDIISSQDLEDFVAYIGGEHFYSSLINFGYVWKKTNAPTPLPGNLWWYLVDRPQGMGLLPEDSELQGFSGYWANETWKCFARGGLEDWLKKYTGWYYYNVMAALPQKIPLMEYPMTDVKVLRMIPHARGGNGDRLRRAVADFACPEAKDIPNLGLDDRGHPIAEWLRDHCRKVYAGSWYAQNVRKDWETPETSEFSNEWGWWGLASLCEELVRSGVDVVV